jgi:hypothetical protein
MANGEMSREQFGTFNGAWMSAATTNLVDGGLLATFIDWRSVDLVITCGRDLGLDLLNFVLWAKSEWWSGQPLAIPA